MTKTSNGLLLEDTGEQIVSVRGGSTSGSPATGGATRTAGIARPLGSKQTRINGQVADNITDENENQWVREAYAPGYEDNINSKAIVEQRYLPFSVNAAATTVVKSGAGFVHQIRVIGGTLGAITVYDNTAASGTVIIPTVTPTAAGLLIENITFANGLTIVTASATIITGAYR